MSLEIVANIPEGFLVPGEDWDALMWQNGKLFSSSFANGNIKVWTPELKLLKEFEAHDYPIYHMAPGSATTFFTSSSDCTIKHWDEINGEFVLLETLQGHEEPPRKLRFDAICPETGVLFVAGQNKFISALKFK